MLRELLDDEAVRQVLRELPAGRHVERVARVERGVEHVGRVRALAEREPDRVLLVRLAPPVVPLVQLERDVRLSTSDSFRQYIFFYWEEGEGRGAVWGAFDAWDGAG